MAKTNKDSIEVIISYIFRYSTAVGMCNYFYDFVKHRLVYCPYALSYCIILDLALGISLPIILLQDLGYSNMGMFVNRPIAAQLTKALTTLNTLAIGLSLISQWTNRGHAKNLFNDLNGIRVYDMANLKNSSRIKQKVGRLIYVKLISSVIMVVGTFMTTFLQKETLTLPNVMTSVYITVLENLLLTLENQFYIGMLYSGYLLRILNYHLAAIVKDMNRFCENAPKHFPREKARLFCNELTKIGKIHTSLHKLTNGVKNLYQYQILVILITVFATQVSVLYFFYVILSGESVNFRKGTEFVMASGGVIMSIGDLWLVGYACGDVVEACNVSGNILKSLSSHNILNKRLGRSIEKLSLQLICEKMHLSICGMFDLDCKTGFSITKASVMKLILLVQMDYKS